MKFFGKRHKGFTLTELSVVIAISGIVIAAVAILLSSMSTHARIRSDENEAWKEMRDLQTQIESKFVGFDSDAYSAPGAEGSTLSFEGGMTVTYSEAQKALYVFGKKVETKYLTSVAFEQDEGNPNLIKCTMTYGSEYTDGAYVFMLVKRTGAYSG